MAWHHTNTYAHMHTYIHPVRWTGIAQTQTNHTNDIETFCFHSPKWARILNLPLQHLSILHNFESFEKTLWIAYRIFTANVNWKNYLETGEKKEKKKTKRIKLMLNSAGNHQRIWWSFVFAVFLTSSKQSVIQSPYVSWCDGVRVLVYINVRVNECYYCVQKQSKWKFYFLCSYKHIRRFCFIVIIFEH